MLGLHGKVSLPQSVNWSKTQAYTTIRSTGEGVSINLAGREPDGIVDPGDFERVRDEVMDRLASFVDPKTGKKPVKAIFKREEVFKGKYADTAPDILMEPEVGYSLTHAKTALEDADWISGDHRPEGTIVAVGPNVRPFDHDAEPDRHGADDPRRARRAGVDQAHRPRAARGRRFRRREPARRRAGSARGRGVEARGRDRRDGGGDASTVSDTEADEMEEHLRGLGYLE